MALVSRSVKTWELWRKDDPHFRERVDRARAEHKRRMADPGDVSEPAVPGAQISFADFCERYLDVHIYPHQQAWVDILEGREPQVRDGWKFVPGEPNRILINTPPGHSKSTVLTVFYTVYKICMDQSTRVIIVSDTKPLAENFLHQIKSLLTDERYAAMHAAYAPPGGFKGTNNGTWNTNRIRVKGADEAATRKGAVPNKDATVEALGFGSQIYGRRADLILLDDIATLANAGQHEKQRRWIDQDVASRLHGGKLVIVGTRVASADLYSELSNPNNFGESGSPWTWLRQPAVEQFAEQPEDWVTLWPESTTPYDIESKALPNGMYEMFPGTRLCKVRASMSPSTWALVYQQEDVRADAVFSPTAVNGSTNRSRKPGLLTAGALGHPRNGREGMYVIASMDPSIHGWHFVLVGTVDRQTQKRYIENAWAAENPSTSHIIDEMKRITDEYKVNEWVIERNGFQDFMLGLPELKTFLQTRGVKMSGHFTQNNKLDPDLGVASVAPLFGTVRRVVEGGRWEHSRDNLLE